MTAEPSATVWLMPNRCRSLAISSAHQRKLNHPTHLGELWNPVIAKPVNVKRWGAIHAASFAAIKVGLYFGEVNIVLHGKNAFFAGEAVFLNDGPK